MGPSGLFEKQSILQVKYSCLKTVFKPQRHVPSCYIDFSQNNHNNEPLKSQIIGITEHVQVSMTAGVSWLGLDPPSRRHRHSFYGSHPGFGIGIGLALRPKKPVKSIDQSYHT